ncbi:hypothetical protein ROS1_27720 [Roseibium sp. ROS1]
MTLLNLRKLTFASAFLACGTASAVASDLMVVFDGSGSMWGQIQGKTKIEIARETLSGVLGEVPLDANIGMIAYGHREKGQCSDIETVVPTGPASQTVPQMVGAANRLKPKGKTPLADAVRIAAEELKFTENAATVVLVTDGIETCNADPCALANELESLGIDFTTHVIGFGLSEDEGSQVQCLAENTGGMYLSAKNAEELSDALRLTVQAEPIAPSEDDFLPMERDVRFIFRDTPDGEQIGIRQLSGVVEKADGGAIADGAFEFRYPEAHGNSAVATLEPGSYVGLFQRDGGTSGGYTVRYAFEVPEGDGEHVIEAALSAALTLNVFINPDLPYAKGDPFPTAIGGSRRRVNFEIFEVHDQAVSEEPVASANMDQLTVVLSPGTYLVRGNLDNTTSAERLVEVEGGRTTEFDFSFDATRVYLDARQADGTPVKRQTAYWYAGPPGDVKSWVKGSGVSKGELTPFYVPTGTWGVSVGGEGYGDRRSRLMIDVPGDYADIRLEVGEGERLDADEKGYLDSPAYTGCLEQLKVKYTGCLVQRADLGSRGEGQEPSSPIEPSEDAATDDLSDNETTFELQKAETGNPTTLAGVFAMYGPGSPLEEIIDDPMHVQSCQRNPVVIYPDGKVFVKRFVDPKGPEENPFKPKAAGTCQVNNGRYDCSIAERGKPVERMVFQPRSMGNGHFEICKSGQSECDVFASCFFPGGKMNATQIMPNGRPLGDLMIERADGQAPGFSYGEDNQVILP